jgi:hypothetical protein
MSHIYPNIVPENNLRLLDALTIKHGPARLLSKFVIEADKAARAAGIRLRLRHDFGELVYVNKQEHIKGRWYPLPHTFDPEYCDLNPENSYWISGENEHGEIVLTQAGRIYYWPDSTLEEEACELFYARFNEGKGCIVTAPAAKLIGGVVFCAGAHWIRPDVRGRSFSHLISRLGRAYALTRWPVTWGVALVAPALVNKGVSAGYGYKHESYSVFYPGSRWGDLQLVVAYLSAAEAYEDLAEFLDTELLDSALGTTVGPLSRRWPEERVTRVSSEPVLQGSNSLS